MESTFGRPTPLCGLEAFPFLVASMTGRGSKAAKPQSLEGDGPQEGGARYSRRIEFPEPALLPSPASWLTGFVGFVRFVVQGSEVSGPRMARRTRMGSRKAKGEEPMPLPFGLGVFAS